jgi:alkanesulfonate monooxygenase SsuD/methylene tetrahydromethanopterin reductase-like flavin-dependent oxidoreductase (luciferase family)
MLDEALDLLTRFWRGERFSYNGEFYKVKDSMFLPEPVQKPRIPIWVAGIWPNRKPFRRAVHWDGVFPLFPQAGNNAIGQLQAFVSYINERRDTTRPFDILYRGFPLPVNDPTHAAEILKPYTDLGVTWWQLSISPTSFGKQLKGEWPLEEMRERILQGPPKF